MEHGDLFVRTWSDEGGGRNVAYVCRWEEEGLCIREEEGFMSAVGGKKMK